MTHLFSVARESLFQNAEWPAGRSWKRDRDLPAFRGLTPSLGGEMLAADQGCRTDEVGVERTFALYLCCSLLLPVCCSLSHTAPEVPGVSGLSFHQPRNGEAIPMSRITTITFMLAALGMATPSVLYHLPEVSRRAYLQGRGKGQRATGLAPLIFPLMATDLFLFPLSKH